MHVIQPVTEVYQRTKVYFRDLPDTSNTRMLVLRMGTVDGTYLAAAGVERQGSTYYWMVDFSGGAVGEDDSVATINIGVWYNVEFYVKATVDGNMTLWVTPDGGSTVKMCEATGDYSDLGQIGRGACFIDTSKREMVQGQGQYCFKIRRTVR